VQGDNLYSFSPPANVPDITQVMARIPGMSQLRTYFPGVPGLGQAEAIEVRAGEERTSVDIAIPPDSSFPTLTVSFYDANGKAVPGDASLVSANPQIPRFFAVPARNPRIATHIEPGIWTILGRANNGAVGLTEVSVGSGDTGATITVGKGGRISGRV